MGSYKQVSLANYPITVPEGAERAQPAVPSFMYFEGLGWEMESAAADAAAATSERPVEKRNLSRKSVADCFGD